jgi:hypothetical protein
LLICAAFIFILIVSPSELQIHKRTDSSSAAFSRYPFADVGRAIQQLYALCFASRQQLHDVAIDKCYFLETQSEGVVVTLYFFKQGFTL